MTGHQERYEDWSEGRAEYLAEAEARRLAGVDPDGEYGIDREGNRYKWHVGDTGLPEVEVECTDEDPWA